MQSVVMLSILRVPVYYIINKIWTDVEYKITGVKRFIFLSAEHEERILTERTR